MPVRPLTAADSKVVERFAVMAAFPPYAATAPDALASPHVRRWIADWGDELGVAWEENGEIRGAAWARRVEPVLVCDDVSGEALPELIISVSREARGTGIGRRLMQELLAQAAAAGCAGLSLTVSERNPTAIRLYESVGFETHGRTARGALVMVWRSASAASSSLRKRPPRSRPSP